MTRVHFLLIGLVISTSLSSAQGLVLKYVHSSSTHQQQFYALPTDAPYSVLRYGAWDFDGDGQQDYVVQERAVGGGSSWILKVYSAVGFTLLWTSEGEIPPQTGYGQPYFYDLTGDGQKELVYEDLGVQDLRVYSPATHECILSSTPTSSDFFVLDFDNDGLLDIGVYSSVSPEEYRVEIWGAGTVASSPPSDLVIQPEGDDLILNWQPVDSCSMYRVYWCFALNGEYASVGTSCTPTFTHPGAAIAPRAYYEVTAITSTNQITIIGRATYAAPLNDYPVNLTR
jgi:hypothetical protein